MKVMGVGRIDEFGRKHANAKERLAAWLHEAKETVWRSTQDVKDRYATASFLPENRVVFNIGGNKYRLLVQIAYNTETVIVLKVGTHEEYNRWKLR